MFVETFQMVLVHLYLHVPTNILFLHTLPSDLDGIVVIVIVIVVQILQWVPTAQDIRIEKP